MASGETHDQSTKAWSIPIGLGLGLLFGWKYALIGGVSFLIGGLWLSPDLDTHSNASNRWGILKLIWWPYRKIIPHRSILSHGPFIGSGIRLSYLIVLISLLTNMLIKLGFRIESELITLTINTIKSDAKVTYSLLIGIEASAWLHIIKDGDP